MSSRRLCRYSLADPPPIGFALLVGRHLVTLQISLSPGDLPHVRTLLPHQLRVWGGQVDEVLLTLDTRPPQGATRFGQDWAEQAPSLARLLEAEAEKHSHARVDEVDYGDEAGRELAGRFFGGQAVPPKDSRGGPFYSYFYGLSRARHDYVLHIDSDMLFGGGSQEWTAEATHLLTERRDVLAVNPLGGPPLENMMQWPDEALDEDRLAFRCTSLSTRVFLVDKKKLREQLLPLQLRAPKRFRSRVKASLHGNPSVAMPEDILTDAMHARQMIRVDLLGAAPGMWSIHPLFRTPAFYATLDRLVERIEAGEVPAEQRGAFELSDSLILAAGARAQ